MTNTIPHELATALLADMEIKSKMQQMYLFQQEVLTHITCHLHRQGILDARLMARELIAGSNSLVKEVPAFDFSVFLAETFAERVAGILETDTGSEDASPPQCE